MGHGGAADGPPIGCDAPAVSRVAVTLDLEQQQDGEVSAQGASLLAQPALLLSGALCFLGRGRTREGASRPELRV